MKHAENCTPTIIKSKTYFNPFEVSFCGFSDSGKTTLIEKIVQLYKTQHSIAYVKHDAHGFQMDTPGKDTARLTNAGATAVFINHENETAFLDHRGVDDYRRPTLFHEFDWVFIEGFKNSDIPKIVVIDKAGKILSEFENGNLKNVIAFVGERSAEVKGYPFFYRDDAEGIGSFIKNYFWQKVNTQPIYGLVLTGGKSSRMGRDKAMIEYRGETQVSYVYKTLLEYCSEAFVSVRSKRPELGFLPQLEDAFLDMGPMGGILTAMKQHPQAAWLVVACDLPLVTSATLSYLLEKRNPFKNATVYKSSEDGLPEPLCALYEAKAKQSLLTFLGLGYQCPRKVLINSRAELLQLPDANWLKNANTPAEYESIINDIKRGML